MNGDIRKTLEVLEQVSKKGWGSPGAGAQRLSALTDRIDWTEVDTFELDWKIINDELVPVVKMEMKSEG